MEHANGTTPGEVRSSEGLGLSEWMPIHEAKRLAELWTKGCDFDNSPQWRAVMRVLLDEANRLDAVGSELKDARALADSEGTRAVKYLRRARKAEAALRELVALKDLKEGPMERSIRASMSIGANPSEQYHQWNEEYQRRKPIAWKAAREVLGPNV